jgi:hypothetical protein
MMNVRKPTIAGILVLSSLVVSALAIGFHPAVAAPPSPPTGVDGVIGPEWVGVTPTFVPYDPNVCSTDACGGQLVAFNVYTREDANYLYVAAQALPAPGDRWNDAVVLGNNILANIYLNTIFPKTTLGSTILILPGGDDCTGLPGYENPNSLPNPTCNETHFGPAGTSVYYVATGGTPGGPNDSPAGTGGVAEMAISWTVLQHDTDNLGFPLVKCLVNVRILQAFGNNFSGAQFGANRFGTFSAPNCHCRESDGNGDFHSGQGEGNFKFDGDGCKDGDSDNVQSTNRGDGHDFQSTQIDSIQYNDLGNIVTITGVGTSNGLPVAFIFVALETGPTTPGWVSFAFSDGYTSAGTLIDGTILLH